MVTSYCIQLHHMAFLDFIHIKMTEGLRFKIDCEIQLPCAPHGGNWTLYFATTIRFNGKFLILPFSFSPLLLTLVSFILFYRMQIYLFNYRIDYFVMRLLMSVVIVNVFGFIWYRFELNWIDGVNEEQNAPHGISVCCRIGVNHKESCSIKIANLKPGNNIE